MVVDIAHKKRARVIAVHAVGVDGDVDVDDVAVEQLTGVGDAVADDFVDGGAHGLAETPVVERTRVGASPDRFVVHDFVDLVGRDAGFDELARVDEYLGGDGAGFAHRIEFGVGAYERGNRWSRIAGGCVRGFDDVVGDGSAETDDSGPHRRLGDRCRYHLSLAPALSHRTPPSLAV